MMFGWGPSAEAKPIVFALCLLITGIATITDWRKGVIPNWLTLPPLFLGPVAYGIAAGAGGLVGSLAAIAVVSAVPLLMWYRDGMAGGDLKLFAALGAMMGLDLALQAELLSFVVGALYAMGRLTWDGKLARTLGNAMYVGLNPVLPQRLRKEMSTELQQTLRLGGAIFAGTLITILGDMRPAWLGF